MRNPVTYRIRRLREQAGKAANARWNREREKQSRLDALDPVRVGGKIVERLVRIIGEERVIERTFYQFDRPCDWKRKRREIFAVRIGA